MPMSHRGPTVPRLPVAPIRYTIESQTVTLADEEYDKLAAMICEVWTADLAALRRELRPWYVRLWEWWRG